MCHGAAMPQEACGVQAGLNCVTMDGDEVRKKGTLAGGYRDPNRSKMQLAKGYKVCTHSPTPVAAPVVAIAVTEQGSMACFWGQQADNHACGPKRPDQRVIA